MKKIRISIRTWILLYLVSIVNAVIEEIQTEIKLIEYDYEDMCNNNGNLEKEFYVKLDKTSFENKESSDQAYAAFQRQQATDLKAYSVQEDASVSRQLDLLTKIGDNILPEAKINKLIHLTDKTEMISLSSKIECSMNESESTCNLNHEGVLGILSKSDNISELQTVWNNWHRQFASNIDEFNQTFSFISAAADLNEYDEISNYWEMLVELPNAYAEANQLWEKIEPLYQKLHNFVRQRLIRLYTLPNNTTNIPVYLLGSEQGKEWSNIAEKILPHPQIYQKIIKEINRQNIGGLKAFKNAEILSENMGLGKFSDLFWKGSIFNSHCPSHLINYCQEGFTEIVTCNKTSLNNFIEAHQLGLKATYTHLSAADEKQSFSFRTPNRISILQESVNELGALLALHPVHLDEINILSPESYKVYANNFFGEQSMLLYNALKVLPKLRYYLTSDLWRINNKNSDQLEYEWCEMRKIHDRIEDCERNTFLSDLDIVNNQPNIGKFYGLLLQFQIFEKIKSSVDEDTDLITAFKDDPSFRELLQNGLSENFSTLLFKHLGISKINAEALLEYFNPLEEYLNVAPLAQVTINYEITTPKPEPSTTTKKPVTVTTKAKNATDTKTSTVANTSNNEDPQDANESKTDDDMGSTVITQYIVLGALVLILFIVVFIVIIARKRARLNKQKMREQYQS